MLKKAKRQFRCRDSNPVKQLSVVRCATADSGAHIKNEKRYKRLGNNQRFPIANITSS